MDDLVGRHISELDTPMPVIDLDAMERNIERLATHARERGISQWPHTKTHKNPEIARMQLDAGAGGLTVAKPGEAEVMASHGWQRTPATAASASGRTPRRTRTRRSRGCSSTPGPAG